MNPDLAAVSVILDSAELGPARTIGELRRTGRQKDAPIAFSYDPAWLEDDGFFVIDPETGPYPGDQYSRDHPVFGAFADGAPDRWGRTLFERREAERAESEHRRPRPLSEWDLLLLVNDRTRMGALRYAISGSGSFLSEEPDAIPLETDLVELQREARVLEERQPSARALSTAISRLLVPGGSLGGARPKATFVAQDGEPWMAKFPAATDRWDVGGWEYLLNDLARDAGIGVPETSRLILLGAQHTFLARRFDRAAGGRRMFASAMTLTGKRDHESASYADIAEAVERHGAPQHIAEDLQQLFRRAVFNVLAGHRDDHLRNHGFLRSPAGWRLSPAFDLNPVPDKAQHEIAVGLQSHASDVELVTDELAPLCRLSTQEATMVVQEVSHALAPWQTRAAQFGLQRSEITIMRGAFAF